ncbi:MAG TPA: MFS transporter [Pyrinomonadaceae bacterium]|nr:MFS transporter [Pyrinomonadaceae bacterium]
MNPWRGLGSLPREVWYLCLAILINRAGTMVLPFLTLYLTIDRGFQPGTAGLALTVYGICAIVTAPLAGRFSDKFGGLRIMKLSLVLSGLILFAFPFVTSLTGIFIVCGLWALASEAFRPPSMAIIGDLAGPERRKAAFALSRLAINLGMSIGPVIGGFLAMRSYQLLFFVDGTTSLFAGLLLAVLPWRALHRDNKELFAAAETETASAKPALRYSDVLKNGRFTYFLIAMLPIEMVFFQPLAAMPLFLVRDLHMTEAGIGLLFAINTVIIIIVEVPLNMAMIDWRHRHSLALGAVLIGVGFGALIFVDGVVGAAITVVVWTFGEMIFLPASAAFVSDIAPREQAGAYMGLYTMGFSVALAVGPWLGTAVMESYGPSAVWVGTFACSFITAVMIWHLRVEEHYEVRPSEQ